MRLAGVAVRSVMPQLKTASPSPTTLAPQRTVKMNLVANQVSDNTKPVLITDEIASACAEYKRVMGAVPAAHEECSAEQLLVIHGLLRDNVPPPVAERQLQFEIK
eukprot:3903155-Amphidinium_carterae.1